MNQSDDAAVPPLHHFLAEWPAVLRHPFWAPAFRRMAKAHHGNGQQVMVIPGLLAGDLLTSRLRRTLAAAGYRVRGWGLGINCGVRPELLDGLTRGLEARAAEGGRVVLIGWSLGGLYAREVAKRRPSLVERVITLGSPFHGDPRANRAWRLYEWLNDHPVDAPPVEVDLPAKPPVPTFALWSRRDGIVAPAASRGLAEESDTRIEVDCHHIDFCTHPNAIAAILAAISAETAPPPPPSP